MSMDMLELRQVLKQRYRKARNIKSLETKEAKKPESCIAPRLNALMPEMIKMLEKNDNKPPPENSPTKKPKSSGESLKTIRARKMKESRDYSWLSSESSEVPKASNPIPNATRNSGVIKKSSNPIPSTVGNNGVIKKSSSPIPSGVWSNGITRKTQQSTLKPEKSSNDAAGKLKPSSAKSEMVSKDSNLVPKSQSLSVKESLKPKQLEESKATIKPSKEGPFMKGKVIKRRRVIEDSDDDDDDDETVGVSSIIQEIMGRRGQRRYKDYGAGGDDRAMVSGFNDILQEESRSARIARKEDAIEAARLEEEAKQERLRKAKKQKLMK